MRGPPVVDAGSGPGQSGGPDFARDVVRAAGQVLVWHAIDQASGNDPTGRVARLQLRRAATAPRDADWSDLDPSGDSFDYSPQDWRRLVFSFGDTGELIHPRFEAGAPRRNPVAALKTQPSDENTLGAGRQPDDPGPILTDSDPNDLAERLDSLLGDTLKSKT